MCTLTLEEISVANAETNDARLWKWASLSRCLCVGSFHRELCQQHTRTPRICIFIVACKTMCAASVITERVLHCLEPCAPALELTRPQSHPSVAYATAGVYSLGSMSLFKCSSIAPSKVAMVMQSV